VLAFLKRHRELLVVSLLLFFPFWSFLAKGTKGREPNFLDRTVLAVTAPPQQGLTWVVDGMVNGFGSYVALRGIREHNTALTDENARLRERLNELEEARNENDRYRKLLGWMDSNLGQEIPAKILGVNPVSTLLSIRIDRGEREGVRKGMPVVTPDGVVGQVVHTSTGYADVVLVTDVNVKLGARVQRSRARATAAGAGSNKALRLEYALRTEDIQENDVIITSGTDGVYPPGLIVGKVVNLARKNYGMFQTAEILPAVDVTKLEELLVLPYSPPTIEPPTPGAPTLTGAK
jgi:rod shape-determining protein MreC